MSIRLPTHLHLMVGSTGHGMEAELAAARQVIRHPPAERGSIQVLLDEHPDERLNIALVDGRFGDVLSVGHKELLYALDRGCRVWGLGSMGALRAAELHSFGMLGYGQVFSHLRDTMAPDDEVAVLHGPAPSYRPVTEALVDLRELLTIWGSQQLVTRRQAAQIMNQLSATWFGHRSLAHLIDLARRLRKDESADRLRAALPAPRRYRVKSRDLTAFLKEEPWLQ
ncbi:TfuA-like protein [Streptomyces sp. NPDC006335]|uniref:TfuA-like protein n=1 Tax=Streptomyces sp. NPDC006335 TaxID=3156895 RepID=UPI0033BE6FD2